MKSTTPRTPSPRRLGLAIAVAVAVIAVGACRDTPPSAPVGGGEGPRVAPPPGRRTNVLLVVMDTARADRCSVHGYGRPTTPFLERLGAEGVVFDAAWAPSSWTVPSHASLFTGLLPTRHHADADLRWTLSHSAVTLAERLRDAGWATGGFSSNHFVSETFGLSQGFQTFVPVYAERVLPSPVAARTHDAALQWIERQVARGLPFFAFVNDMEPHAPYAPSADDQARFVRGQPSAADLAWGRAYDFPDTLPAILGRERLPPERMDLLSDLYDAEICALDREIERLVGRLRDLGVLDDTLVVVTGDHGEHLGENGQLGHSITLEHAVLHVPMVVRHPRWFSGGRRVGDVVRLQDVFPTVLEVCGLPIPESLDAASLVGDVSGRIAAARLGRPKGFLSACARTQPDADVAYLDIVQRSAFDGRFLLIELGADTREPRAVLRDLVADPRGETDVSAERPDVVRRLRAHLPEEPSARRPAPGTPPGATDAPDVAPTPAGVPDRY